MLKVRIKPAPKIGVKVNSNAHLKIGLSGEFVQRVVADPYEGSYEFTPTEEEQTIQIEGKTASENIKINAIPENYGRLTWEGGSLKIY